MTSLGAQIEPPHGPQGARADGEPMDRDRLRAEVEARSRDLRRLTDAVGRVVVGQQYMVQRLLVGMLTGGHVLLEGVPGLAKTLTVSTLAKAVRASFSRVQFTPDLLPADVVGTLIYNPREGTFAPRQGPVFANIVLADEINRAPAKVQSALLEAMQEKQVTIGDRTYPLPKPFLVLATQNPIEQEGTYPLPEAQVDRFMLKLRVGYPTRADERAIIDRMAASAPAVEVEPVIDIEEVGALRRLVDQVYVDEKIKDYVVDLVHATREPGAPEARLDKKVASDLARLIEFGASPRASIALTMASRAHAFLEGRAFVTPSDVKAIGADVLRHRVLIGYEAEAEGVSADDVVRMLFDHVRVP